MIRFKSLWKSSVCGQWPSIAQYDQKTPSIAWTQQIRYLVKINLWVGDILKYSSEFCTSLSDETLHCSQGYLSIKAFNDIQYLVVICDRTVNDKASFLFAGACLTWHKRTFNDKASFLFAGACLTWHIRTFGASGISRTKRWWRSKLRPTPASKSQIPNSPCKSGSSRKMGPSR